MAAWLCGRHAIGHRCSPVRAPPCRLGNWWAISAGAVGHQLHSGVKLESRPISRASQRLRGERLKDDSSRLIRRSWVEVTFGSISLYISIYCFNQIKRLRRSFLLIFTFLCCRIFLSTSSTDFIHSYISLSVFTSRQVQATPFCPEFHRRPSESIWYVWYADLLASRDDVTDSGRKSQ